VNKGVDIDGHMEDPKIQIKVLEAAIVKIRDEMSQTTLPVPGDKPDLAPKKILAEKKPETPKK
jgi:hypothetical protein